MNKHLDPTKLKKQVFINRDAVPALQHLAINNGQSLMALIETTAHKMSETGLSYVELLNQAEALRTKLREMADRCELMEKELKYLHETI